MLIYCVVSEFGQLLSRHLHRSCGRLQRQPLNTLYSLFSLCTLVRPIADSIGLIWIISTSTTFTVIVRREPVYKWSS